MRKKDDQNNYSNDECEKSYGIWQNKSNTDEDWSTTRSTGRSGYPNSRSLLQLNSVETRLEPNLTLDSIHNDLSFRNVYCSTPKHLKVCEFANGMNRMNTEETPYHHLQIDFLDSEYEPGDLNSEYDEFEDGGIDNEGLYNIIGDVEPMTNFSMDEYFEKYRNRIISDNELEDDANNNRKEADENEDPGFEELGKDDCRKKIKKMSLWQINKTAKERGEKYL
ncbi:uncharacterized protein LOC129724945 [Wyeomyia smithii]|uniref:uncharacterized protein LOC129724945 n=1 Tax=Wyeomyia smithii TaxID=174621 RepID=UPI002468019A|nr:uncharacterized protein LOC129724945 [Wyeomyia smithii]